MLVVNPEQTASLFSYITFFYLEEIIRKGYRVDPLSVSSLPPLPDYDAAIHLKSRGTKVSLNRLRGLGVLNSLACGYVFWCSTRSPFFRAGQDFS